jgi:hypothetical protein
MVNLMNILEYDVGLDHSPHFTELVRHELRFASAFLNPELSGKPARRNYAREEKYAVVGV